MAENAPLWPKMDGTFLEVEDCLRTALMDLLGGDMGFNNMDDLVRGLETGFTLVLVNVNGLRGDGGGWRGRDAERTDGFKQFLPSDIDS